MALIMEKPQQVIGDAQPRQVSFFTTQIPLRSIRMARLAKNIRQATIDGEQKWVWDECVFQTELSEEDILENFDHYWNLIERNTMTNEEWRNDVENTLLDLIELVI